MKTIAKAPLTRAIVMERLQLLPDEIYLAEFDFLIHCEKLIDATRQMKDAESEILTRDPSPIDGKNPEIRKAQLQNEMKSWDETVSEWKKSVEREKIKVQRLKDQQQSMLAIASMLGEKQ